MEPGAVRPGVGAGRRRLTRFDRDARADATRPAAPSRQESEDSVLDTAIRGLASIGRVLDRIELTIISAIAGVLVVTTGWGVVSRYFLGQPLPWPEEVGVFLYIWMSYVGAAAVLRRRKHIAIAFFVDAMPPRRRGAVMILVHLLILGFLCIVVVQSLKVMPPQLTIEIGAAIRLPKAYLTLALLLAAISMILTAVQIVLEEVRALLHPPPPAAAPADVLAEI